MHALIIGASGATGTSLARLLGNDGRYRKITAFTRRPMPAPAGTEDKWVNHIVDFKQPATWAHLVQGDAAFSCLGTTLKTAGSQSAQFEIDHDYQLSFAQAAAQNGVGALVLVSAAQANADSRFFYMRMKGQLENAVHAMCQAAAKFPQGVHILEAADIWQAAP